MSRKQNMSRMRNWNKACLVHSVQYLEALRNSKTKDNDLVLTPAEIFEVNAAIYHLRNVLDRYNHNSTIRVQVWVPAVEGLINK